MPKPPSKLMQLTRAEKLHLRIQDQYRTGNWTEKQLADSTGLTEQEIEDVIEPYKDLESC